MHRRLDLSFSVIYEPASSQLSRNQPAHASPEVIMAAKPLSLAFSFSTDALLDHWQGHRRVTRRMIEAFPEEALFSYSIGGMRPFSDLALEMIGMCRAGIRGVATREWVTDVYAGASKPRTREELLRLWDEVTDQLNTLWP